MRPVLCESPGLLVSFSFLVVFRASIAIPIVTQAAPLTQASYYSAPAPLHTPARPGPNASMNLSVEAVFAIISVAVALPVTIALFVECYWKWWRPRAHGQNNVERLVGPRDAGTHINSYYPIPPCTP